MNPHLQRGLILLHQRRPDLAEAELRLAIAQDPNDGDTHAILADCLCDCKRLPEANDEARQAILLAPDLPRCHLVMARVMFERHRFAEASAAVEEAIRLDPHDPFQFARLATIRYAQRDWTGTLKASEAGLEIEPQNIDCNNFRAMALVKLGRREEASAAIGSVLALDPENAFSHANLGWTLLHQGEPTKAKEHFREALRLEPGMDFARRGLIEAMKARNPIYALMLRYFLWMGRLSRRAQLGVVIGGLFVQQALASLANQYPALNPYVLPIMIAYVVFALMTWLANPLFNLLLFLNRFGRHALSREQKIESIAVGLMVGTALASLAAWGLLAWADSPIAIVAPLAAGFFGFMTLPVSGIFKVPRGWPRLAMLGYGGVLAFVGLAVIPAGMVNRDLSETLLTVFLFGCVLSWVPINFLVSVNVRR
jgi:Tfp pilus assembly protein PilF